MQTISISSLPSPPCKIAANSQKGSTTVILLGTLILVARLTSSAGICACVCFLTRLWRIQMFCQQHRKISGLCFSWTQSRAE